MNLIKLTTDAAIARAAAMSACDRATDGGSANLDAAFLRLDKGDRSAPVIAALASAGLSASPARWIGRGVMIQPPGLGQAGKRYASNRALVESLMAAGWPVLPYYVLD